jgi:hypothetical protein
LDRRHVDAIPYLRFYCKHVRDPRAMMAYAVHLAKSGEVERGVMLNDIAYKMLVKVGDVCSQHLAICFKYGYGTTNREVAANSLRMMTEFIRGNPAPNHQIAMMHECVISHINSVAGVDGDSDGDAPMSPAGSCCSCDTSA